MISSASKGQTLTNQQICTTLEELANLLEAQGANPFRVQAYRRAAGTLRELKGSVQQILKAEGVGGLMQLPGIGRSLGHAIEHLLRSGRLPLLERLRGEDAPSGSLRPCPILDRGSRAAFTNTWASRRWPS